MRRGFYRIRRGPAGGSAGICSRKPGEAGRHRLHGEVGGGDPQILGPEIEPGTGQAFALGADAWKAERLETVQEVVDSLLS